MPPARQICAKMAPRDLFPWRGQLWVNRMRPTPEFHKQVKDALEHLYDTAYLETHPLLSQFANEAADSRLTRAQKLRGLLKETIEELRPSDGSPRPATSPQWRSYLALRHRFVQGMSPDDTGIELGISLRQLQRELHKGLDAVTALLWDKRERAAPPASEARQELDSELNGWEFARQRCDVRALVDDTLWTCKPLLDERGVKTPADLPADLPPVFVDATMTRQMLFKLLRILTRTGQGATCTLRAHAEAQVVHLALRTSRPAAIAREADWQTALWIARQQGIAVETRTLADGGSEIELTLPRAIEPRVLVIDDNAAIHQLFERYLAPHHYEVLHAHGGAEALQLAADEQPDAITLDVMMPNVDGWQVLRQLAAHPKTARIPIVICSVLKEPDLAFSLGARAYLKKPVDRLELVTTLARLLSTAAPAGAAPPPTPEDS